MQSTYDLETRSGSCACPACAETIDLSDVMQHEIVECKICAGEFVEVEDDKEDYGE